MRLLKVFWNKEKIYWKRILGVWKRCKTIMGKTIGFLIVVILVSIAHYAFALMHFSFECFLWIFNRKQYENNLYRLEMY